MVIPQRYLPGMLFGFVTKPINKLLLLILCIAGACNFTADKRPEHPEYFDPVIKHAQDLRNNGFGKEAIAFLDSSYAVFPSTPGPFDLFRKYEIITFHYSYIVFDYEKALLYSDSMVNEIEKVAPQHTHDYVVALFSKGHILLEQNRYNTAFEYFYKGKKFAEKYLDTCYYAWCNNSLGLVLYRQQKYREAISYFETAYEQTAHCDTTDLKSSFIDRQQGLNNIALCYEKMGLADSALLLYNKALEFIQQRAGSFPESREYINVAKGVIYGNIGGIYAQQGRMKEAEALFKENIRINTPKGNENRDAQLTAVKLGRLYLSTGRFNEAYTTLQEVKNGLDTLPFDESKLLWAKLQWEYYDTLHNVPNAYAAFKQYTQLKDSLALTKKDLAGADFNREFLTLSQKYELNLLKKEAEQKTIYLILAVGFLLMLAFIMYLIWKNYRQSKNSVAELTALNTHVNSQNTNLQKTLSALEQSQEENKRMMKIVAHDLRSPIGSIVSLTTLMLDEEQQYAQEQKEMLYLVNKSSVNSLEFIDDLLQINTVREEMKKEPVEMATLLQYCIDMLQIKTAEKQQRIILKAEPVTLPINREKIWRVISNLLTNAMKFSPVGATIIIRLEKKQHTAVIAVQDHGIGIPEDLKDIIFNMFTEARRRGTEGEQSFGLGLAISKQIVEAHGGNMWFESQPGNGTTFYVELPV